METAAAPLARPIVGAQLWYGPAMRECGEWTHLLEDDELHELEAAVRATGDRPLLEITKSDFSLPTLGPELERTRDEVVNGRGFALLRGLPVERYGLEASARAYWGMGIWLGEPISQNPAGHLLGHVKDIGARADNPNQRGYQSGDALPFHTDVGSDMVSLLCLKPARAGGLSSIASGAAIYNEMLASAPDLVAELSRPLAWDRRGEVPPGKRPWYELPVFSYYQGHLLTAFVRRFIESAQRFPQAPPLTARQREALALVSELAASEAIHLSMDFHPGDIQILNNHATLHNRTAYEDFAEPARKRHLLRFWLAAPNGWPLPNAYRERYPHLTPSGRPAGIVTAGTEPTAPLDVA